MVLPLASAGDLLAYRGPAATTVDVVAAVVLLVFLVAGWRSGGGHVLGRVLGAIAGVLLGLALAPVVAPHVPVRAVWVVLGCALLGGALGQGVGGWVGGAVSTALRWVRLGFLDRLAGAVGALLVGAVVCWAAAGAATTWGSPQLHDAVRRSALVQVLGGRTPSFSVVSSRVASGVSGGVPSEHP